MKLDWLSKTFAICRLERGANWPEWATGAFVSVTRTEDELSVVCPQECVPPGVQSQAGWRCLRVAGPLDLSEIGILASLVQPLAAARISVLVIGTYDTDYLLVRAAHVAEATRVLRESGHQVDDSA